MNVELNRHTILGTIAGLLAGAFVIGIVLVLGATRQDAGDGADTAEQIRQAQLGNTELLELIKSCTIEPAGRCAQVQRKNTQLFLKALARERNVALSYALSCADRPYTQTPAQIARCIREGMKDGRAGQRDRQR